MVQEIIGVLRELGQSWPCASRIAVFFQKLHDEQKQISETGLATRKLTRRAKDATTFAGAQQKSPCSTSPTDVADTLSRTGLNMESSRPSTTNIHIDAVGYPGESLEDIHALHEPLPREERGNSLGPSDVFDAKDQFMLDGDFDFFFNNQFPGQADYSMGDTGWSMQDGSFSDQPFLSFDLFSTDTSPSAAFTSDAQFDGPAAFSSSWSSS